MKRRPELIKGSPVYMAAPDAIRLTPQHARESRPCALRHTSTPWATQISSWPGWYRPPDQPT